jgi:hypothetical protein
VFVYCVKTFVPYKSLLTFLITIFSSPSPPTIFLNQDFERRCHINQDTSSTYIVSFFIYLHIFHILLYIFETNTFQNVPDSYLYHGKNVHLNCKAFLPLLYFYIIFIFEIEMSMLNS